METGEKLAKAISILLSNPIVDGLFGLAIATQEAVAKWGAPNPLIGIAAGLICGVLPYLGALILFVRKKSDIFVSRRELRPKLFIFGLVSYLLGTLLFWYLGLLWLASFSFVMFLGTIVYLLITWRWKISIHVSGLTVPLTIMSMQNGLYMLPGVLLIPALMWARVRLGAHTWSQVVVSALVSLSITYLGATMFMPSIQMLMSQAVSFSTLA